jgi:methylated-DNA-[protein]-cysteine S-methyltransferase
MTTWFAMVPSPVGPLRLAKRGDALVELTMRPEAHPVDSSWREDPARLEREAAQIAEYFAGVRLQFDFPIDPEGTPFQRRVWAGLTRIPFGQTMSYGALANALGKPGAARAIGSANSKNPIAIVVPCHRVIAADGSLCGFASGTERKSWLLDWEQRAVSIAAPGNVVSPR